MIVSVKFTHPTQVKQYGVAIDTSGQPGVKKAFCVGCVWFAPQDLLAIGAQLQTIRDVHGCESPIHFCDLGKKGRKESVARDWIRLALKSPSFPVRGRILAVPNSGFDLSYYGTRERALNRVLKTCVLSTLATIESPTSVVETSFFVDGSDESDPLVAGQCDYIKNFVGYASDRRRTIPMVARVDTEVVTKKPLGPRGTELRATQDLVALVDILVGCARVFIDPLSIDSMKMVMLEILKKRRDLAAKSGINESPIEVNVYEFPSRTFTDMDQYQIAVSN